MFYVVLQLVIWYCCKFSVFTEVSPPTEGLDIEECMWVSICSGGFGPSLETDWLRFLHSIKMILLYKVLHSSILEVFVLVWRSKFSVVNV